MARSKHRKAHKQALSHRESIHCTPSYDPEGTPVEVGKGKYRVNYPEPKDDNTIEGMVVDVEGDEVTVDTGDKGLIRIPQGNEPLKKGDRIQVQPLGPLGAANRNGDVFHTGSTPLRGQSRFLGTLNDAVDCPGRRGGMSEPAKNLMIQAMDCPELGTDVTITVPKEQVGDPISSITGERIRGLMDANYADLEQRVTAQLLKENPGKTIEELIYGKPVKCPICPATCSICGAVWPCTIPEHSRPRAHFEMGAHKDPVTGEVVFDEVSLCPGPDPNGITDLVE